MNSIFRYEVTVVGFNIDLDDPSRRVLGYGVPKPIETIGTRMWLVSVYYARVEIILY